MLANPVVGQVYSDPLVWGIALVAMWAEVRCVLWQLRRWGVDVRGLLAPLFALNLTTWLPFLVAVEFADRGPLPPWLAVTALEGAVVVVEAVLLHAATRGRLFTRGLPCTPLSWPRAFAASALGNLVSVAVSLAVPAVMFLLARAARG